MFTGIVQATGSILRITPVERGARVEIGAGSLGLTDVAVGDSIAVDGCCLTVVARGEAVFSVDVSEETLNCTAELAAGQAVNLEKALRLSDRLGGHLVSGHIDGIGAVTRLKSVGESRLLEVRAPHDLAKYIARKGSIAVNGVSLTVNHVEHDRFEVNLIPHTLAATNLRQLTAGARVNIEIDVVARYIERLLEASQAVQPHKTAL